MSGERANKNLRLFDEKLGPFAVWLAGLFRKLELLFQGQIAIAKPPHPDTVKSVALVKMAAIGDTVLLSGLINDLKDWNPEVRVVLFVGGSNEPFAKLLPMVDEVVRLPLTDFADSWQKIRKEKFDLVLNCDPWARISAVFGALIKSRWLVGFMTPGQYRHFADDQLVPHRPDLHEIDNFRALLQAVNLPSGKPPLRPLGFNEQPPDPYLLVFHLWPGGTKSYLKEWPADRWRHLAVLLGERGPFRFVVSGSPEQFQRNQAWIQSLPWELRNRFTNLAGQSLENTLAIVARARVTISVDTGIMHVSAALGTPTVALHGPTRPERWGGIGPHVFPVMSSAPQAGLLHLGFDYQSDANFLEAISVDQVYQKVEKALEVRR